MKKILAIDFGTKNIGLALSDREQKLAFSYKRIDNNKLLADDFSRLKKMCQQENVEKIIVGMPINLSGRQTKTTELVFNFVEKLQSEIDFPIELIDERLTTEQAHKLMDKKSCNSVDELSAQIMLQSYLDEKNLSVW